MVGELEEAGEVASAQLDLAFEVLKTVSMRKLPADLDTYKSLMEACGRCGDTQRARTLVDLMKKDGFVLDGEILSCFVAAFAHDESGGHEASLNTPLSVIVVRKRPGSQNSTPYASGYVNMLALLMTG